MLCFKVAFFFFEQRMDFVTLEHADLIVLMHLQFF